MTLIEINHVQEIPVAPVWLSMKWQPFAKATVTSTGINPWSLLYKSDREQSMIDYQLTSYRRAMKRMLTTPLDQLEQLPLLSNSRMILSDRPWTATRRGPMAGKFKEKTDVEA